MYVRCIYCGAEQEAPSPAERGSCVRCSHPFPLASAGLSEALEALRGEGLSSQTAPFIEEIHAADKRLSGLVALVPFLGVWLIWRSPAHTRDEKRRLSWIALGLAVLESVAVILLLPGRADEGSRLRSRIDSQIHTLGNIVKEYGEKNGAFPDTATWERSTKDGNPAFIDPWGHPYRYEATEGGVTIRTLGRDGVEGGTGEDADVAATFAPPSPSTNRLAVSGSGEMVQCTHLDGSLYVGPAPPTDCSPVGAANTASSSAGTAVAGAPTTDQPMARRDHIEHELESLGKKLQGFGQIDASQVGTTMAERRDTLFRMLGLYLDWHDLKKQVAKTNRGEIPSWWYDGINCGGCLSQSAVEAELAALR